MNNIFLQIHKIITKVIVLYKEVMPMDFNIKNNKSKIVHTILWVYHKLIKSLENINYKTITMLFSIHTKTKKIKIIIIFRHKMYQTKLIIKERLKMLCKSHLNLKHLRILQIYKDIKSLMKIKISVVKNNLHQKNNLNIKIQIINNKLSRYKLFLLLLQKVYPHNIFNLCNQFHLQRLSKIYIKLKNRMPYSLRNLKIIKNLHLNSKISIKASIQYLNTIIIRIQTNAQHLLLTIITLILIYQVHPSLNHLHQLQQT